MDETHARAHIRTVQATRMVLPLREGGSVPALMEADDDGLYVVKLHGAGQGPKSLIAELVAGEIGRLLGLDVPELVFVTLDEALAHGEPDPEIQDHLARSAGLNLGLDFLPSALPFDLARRADIDPLLAADIVWFDGLIANVDRTTRNPNMLRWHDQLWLIDHGASIYPHHRWTDPAGQGRRDFPAIADHVLLPMAGSLVEADLRLRDRITENDLWAVIGSIPDAWLEAGHALGDADARRESYITYFRNRLEAPRPFIAGAERARTAAGVGTIDPQRATRGRRRE